MYGYSTPTSFIMWSSISVTIGIIISRSTTSILSLRPAAISFVPRRCYSFACEKTCCATTSSYCTSLKHAKSFGHEMSAPAPCTLARTRHYSRCFLLASAPSKDDNQDIGSASANEGAMSKYETMSVRELGQVIPRISGDAKELQRYVDGAKKKSAAMMLDGSDDRPKLNGFIETAENFLIYLAENAKVIASAKQISRVASIEFDIANSAMKYTLDLERFQDRVELLFDWHDENSKMRDQYTAPYFPLVQSSGMGKTKLLYELRKKYESQSQSQQKQPPLKESSPGAGSTAPKRKQTEMETETVCKLVQCMNANAENTGTGSIFTSTLVVPGGRTEVDAKKIRDELNRLIDRDVNDDGNNSKNTRYVLLFDEAQHLLQTDIEGWAFRCVRWWLREVRSEQVVAVFSGTTSKLANFYREPPAKATTSRDDNKKYLGNGKELYEPFFQICTIGLVAATEADDTDADTDNTTEYKNAIPFGRPLFARLQKQNALTDEVEHSILGRMTLSQGVWASSKDACLSILATRAQMGQVPFDLASEIVSMGYASLTHCSREDGKVADVCFFPDPVCARLAMSLMIEKRKHGSFIGKSPAFWMNQASAIFSQGLCRPQKGDLGEVAAAFYLLFCGDQLRHALDPKLETFSVPLAHWLSLLQQPVSDPNLAASVSMSTANFLEPSVSFIHVCRNNLRLPLADLVPLLPSWYKAGRALYQYPSCPAYDIIAPIRYMSSTDGKSKYCPLLVSVKNRLNYGEEQQKSACLAMQKVMEEAEIKVGVCLLLLFLGEQGNRVDMDKLMNPGTSGTDKLMNLESGGIVTRVVVVPKDDPFGVSNFVDVASTSGGHLAEVYVSHPEVQLTTCETETMLRKKTDTDAASFARKLQMAFRSAAGPASLMVRESGGGGTGKEGEK